MVTVPNREDLMQVRVWWNIAGAYGHESAKKNPTIEAKKFRRASSAATKYSPATPAKSEVVLINF
jgi:hypothetical protein